MVFYVIGSMSKDTILHVQNFPPVNGEAFCLDRIECHGGAGANVAVYVSSFFGIETYLLSCVGTDHVGKSLLGKLQKAGVSTDMIKHIEEKPSTRHTILLDRYDNRMTYVYSGAMDSFSPIILEQVIQENRDHSLIISPLRANSVIDVFKMLDKSSMKVFWIPGSSMLEMRNDFFELLPKIYCLILNKDESLRYSKCKDVFEAARYLMKKGFGILAVTLGGEGSLVFQGNSYVYAPALKVKSILSVGCGDAFAAGFAGALIQGDSLEEAAKLGNLLGAFMATQPFMLDAIPSRDQIQAIKGEGLITSNKEFLSSSLFNREHFFKD